METIAVLGPGGVGGFLAAALQRAGRPVTVIAREPTADVIARDGLAIQSVLLGEFSARPAAVTVLEEPSDVLLVCTKATTLAPALERVRAECALVVPLLNGLDHMAVVRDRFGSDRVAAGVIRIESDRATPGRVVQTSPSVRVDLATEQPGLADRVAELADALVGAGVPAVVEAREAQILWSKLARLCALACTTSASDQPIGFVRTDPEWRATLIACIAEVCAVANASGAEIDPAARLAELDDAHPELGSSMRRDLAAGREPELDAIAGAVMRAGQRAGVPCPTIARLADTIAQRAGIAAPRV